MGTVFQKDQGHIYGRGLCGLMLIGLLGMGGAHTVAAQDSLFVDTTGNVGVGTATPDAALNVVRADGSAKVKVTDSSTASFPQTMFEIRRPGAVRFDVADDSTSVLWVFQNRLGAFDITKAGTGVQEFKLDGSGNLTILGTLIQGSSRTSKENIEVANGADILEKLAELPIAEWNYKNDNQDVRHLGPMAEDFAAVFELGSDDKHIAPGDMAGVALAALQALREENETLKKSNAELKTRLDRLESLLLSGQQLSRR